MYKNNNNKKKGIVKYDIFVHDIANHFILLEHFIFYCKTIDKMLTVTVWRTLFPQGKL